MQRLLYKDKALIGLDISTSDIKVMAINNKKDVIGYGAIDISNEKFHKSLEENDDYLLLQLKKLFLEKIHGHLPSPQVAVSIPTSQTYSRTFSVPASTKKDLREAIELEISQYIPIPVTSLYVDYEIISESEESINVLVSAAPRLLIDKIVDACSRVNLTVNLVEPGINSIARLLRDIEEGDLPTVIVDISSTATDVAILEKGIIRVTGSTAIGGNTFTLDISKKLNIPLEKSHQLKVIHGLNPGSRQEIITQALNPSLKKISLEIRRVMRYYEERIKGIKVEQLIIVGGGSNIPGIGEFFTNNLVIPARVASPWQSLNFGKLPQPAKQLKPRYITVAGIASLTKEEIFK